MADRDVPEAPSPSASSLRLPLSGLGRHSRRNSVNSLASRSKLDKETLNHALDKIHISASRSDTLTTFDEFAPPPPSSSGNDSRSITGDFVQGGFSGIYGRIKTSFGSAKEAFAGSPVGTNDVGAEIQLSRSRAPSSKPSSKPLPETAVSSPVLVSTPSSVLNSPQNATFSHHQAPTTNGRPSSTSSANPSVHKQQPTKQRPSLTTQGTTAVQVRDGTGARNDQAEGKEVVASPTSRITSERASSRGSKQDGLRATGSDVAARRPSGSPQASSTYAHKQSATIPIERREQDSSDDEIVIVNEDGALRTPRTLAATAATDATQSDNTVSRRGLQAPFTIPTATSSTAPVDKTTGTPAAPSRPPLLQISQSHLPGFSVSRLSSSDGIPSSSSTVVASRPIVSQTIAESRRPDRPTSAATQSSQAMSHMRRRVLSKEFWMRDENAKDCFYCGDAFNTFRRKHHCRTCGQIFDSKCTSLVSGRYFGQSGTVRVCKSCEVILNNNEDDSSDYSEDGAYDSVEEGQVPEKSDVQHSVREGHVKMSGVLSQNDHSRIGTPTLSIPMSRKPGERKRRSAVIEVDSSPTLARPSSSRSLRSLSGRPRSSSHKRHHSKHQHMRSLKYGDFAPFHRHDEEEAFKERKLSAFHNDSIIDPDLAPFMSDEGSSEDEQLSIFATLSSQHHSQSIADQDRAPYSAMPGGIRKSRSRGGDKAGPLSALARDPDFSAANNWHPSRYNRRQRNISIGSASQLRLSPRRSKSNALLRNLGANLGGLTATLNAGLGVVTHANSPVHQSLDRNLAEKRMTYDAVHSVSQRNHATVELNGASISHVRNLLKQLLQDADVTYIPRWEKALMPILLRCTDDVTPNVQRADDIDVRHYIKLKKITGSNPSDTSYISGVVFSKNVALKSMKRHISHPRIAIVTFAIEYARHQQHFMSLDPVIAQEREYLRNLVNRIAAHKPDVLFVQRGVAGLALQFLNEAGIAVAYNVKYSVLNAVSRCTKARMISSLDKLAGDHTHLGHCESFDVKTYVTQGVKKTYIFLSGCDPELGCTIVLRGAALEMLRRVKRVTEFMCYVVYSLKLETCLLRDEYIIIPTAASDGTLSPGHNTAKKVAEASNSEPAAPADTVAQASYKLQKELEKNSHGQSFAEVKNEDVLKASSSSVANSQQGQIDTDSNPEGFRVPDDVPMPSFYGDMVEKHRTKILSASPFVKFMQPYLLMRAREQERRLAYLQRLKDQYSAANETLESGEQQSFKLVLPEMVHTVPAKASRQVRDFLHAVHNAEYEKAMHNYQTQKRQWEAYISGNMDLFNPFNHQKIAVLYSVVNSHTSTPCIGPEIIALDFYHEHDLEEGFAADCTLGQYVEDLCHGASAFCDSAGCDRKMLDHHRQYVHGEGQISVFVQKYPSKLSGINPNTILMWSNCRKCNQETPPIPMSGSTWRYSFAKYLELTFWSDPMRPRSGTCEHDIHRDHLRYFGLNNLALRVQYDTVQLYEVIVPRPIVTWKVDSDLRLKNEQYMRIEGRLERFYGSVRIRLKGINVESMMPEKIEPCRMEVEKLMKRANEEQDWCLRKLQEKYMQSRYYEIIPLNRAIRAIVEKAIAWDDAFTEFEREFFPSEKDIRRLAALQLKKLFLERDESTSTLQSVDEGSEEGKSIEQRSPETQKRDAVMSRMPSQMSPEKAHDMLSSVVQQEQTSSQDEKSGHATVTDNQSDIEAKPQTSDGKGADTVSTPKANPERDDVRHLDLAVSNASRRVESEGSKSPPSPSQAKDSTPVNDPHPPDKAPSPLDQSVTITTEDMAKETSSASVSTDAAHTKIPRPIEGTARELKSRPVLASRTQSQPGVLETIGSLASNGLIGPSTTSQKTDVARPLESPKGFDKRISERLGLSTFKAAKSMIPRSIPSKKDVTRVSTLAKHFEQLSREFEKERMRERRQRVERSRQARAYQLASSKPIVEVYKNVHEAVQEREANEEDVSSTTPPRISTDTSGLTESGLTESTDMTSSSGSPAAERQQEADHESKPADSALGEHAVHDGHAGSDADGEISDTDRTLLDDIEIPGSIEDSQTLSPSDSSLDLSIDLPKHEKTSLMKMLSSFWSERSASGWSPLDFPFANIEHVWGDSDIIVREDEPSSIIALALSCSDYLNKLDGFRTRPPSADPKTPLTEDRSIELNLLHQANTNIRYNFTNRGVRAQCKIFYAQSFDALRRKCGVADRFVESLSRCLKWDSKGGKSKSLFLRTLDDRFVLKSLSPVEVTAFFRFAPNYFAFTHQNLFKGLPSVIAKMFGLFQVQIKTPTGRDFDWYMLVMENLFYDREPNRRFDLKGSMRNRKIQSTGERDEVLLDENLVDIIYSETPIFVREHTKKLLKASVWNDTLFLSKQNVMDYSLMAGFDDKHREIVVGIIDCIRTYTWDKKLETWIKDRGKNKPTITSPKDYRSRFRIAMAKYMLQAPNCWHQFQGQRIERRMLRLEGPGDGGEEPTGDHRRGEDEVDDVDPEARMALSQTGTSAS